MIDLIRKARARIVSEFLTVPYFPFDTGQLREHFFDNGETEGGGIFGLDMMKNPVIFYGFILNGSMTIRQPFRIYNSGKNRHDKAAYVTQYARRPNRHFRFIDKFFEGRAIEIFQEETGTRRIQ